MIRTNQEVRPVRRSGGFSVAPGFAVGLALGLGFVQQGASAQVIGQAEGVSFSGVYPYGYSPNDINSVAFSRSNLVTHGGYQFIAFYRAGHSNRMQICRRELGSDAWSVINTGFVPVDITDSHDNVNMAVDGNDRLHVSWGMHNNPMRYVVSDQAVTGETFDGVAVTFTQPSFWSGTGANADNSVTYPEFYTIPGSGDLLFVYRQGGTGGGSGNGDQWFTRYDAGTGTFEKNLVIQGTATSVNAYLNRLAYDSAGGLHASWTWRDTPDFQTNHNIIYATSPDDAESWSTQAGVPYALPITETQAQVLATIPQGSTLINQTDMTVDSAGNPLIATWYAPGAQSGDNTRQYMLHYYDGSQWRVSQVYDRDGRGSGETNVANVRDLARPLVMVDNQDRVFYVMRFDEADNRIVVAYSEDRQNWTYLALNDEDMGDYEPSYDAELWRSEHKLHMFYQRMGSAYGPYQPVSVLQWDPATLFGPVPCSDADASEPFGVLDVDDVLAFLGGFASGDALADIAAPEGTFNIDDVLAFLTAFASGCP